MGAPTNFGIFSRNIIDLEHLRKNWGWLLVLGIGLIGLGMVSIAVSTAVTVISVLFFGTILILSGIAQTIYAFWMREWSGFFLSILAGLLYTVVGIFFLIHPIESAVSLTLILAAFYIVGGLFRISVSIMSQFEQWGWALFSGIIKFILGLLILAGWPETGLWVLGLFIGIDLVFFGWFWVLLALTARNAKV